MEKKIRILIAEHDCCYRDGLRLLIEDTLDFELAGTVDNAVDVISFVVQKRPDILILDNHIPAFGSVNAIEEIRVRSPNTHILFFMNSLNKKDFFEGVAFGVKGFLLKGQTTQELQYAIRLVASGKVLIDGELIESVQSYFSRVHYCQPKYHFPELTHRENHVLSLIAQGLKNREIASECKISEKTVRNHATNIFSKLNVQNRIEAITHLQESCPHMSVVENQIQQY